MKFSARWETDPTTVTVKGATTDYYKVEKLETDVEVTANQLQRFIDNGSGADYTVQLPSMDEIIRRGINCFVESRTRSALTKNSEGGTSVAADEPVEYEVF